MFEIKIHPTPCTLLRYIVGYKVVSQVFLPKEKSLYLFLSSGVVYYTRVIYNRAFALKKFQSISPIHHKKKGHGSYQSYTFFCSKVMRNYFEKTYESTLKCNNSFDKIDWKSYYKPMNFNGNGEIHSIYVKSNIRLMEWNSNTIYCYYYLPFVWSSRSIKENQYSCQCWWEFCG